MRRWSAAGFQAVVVPPSGRMLDPHAGQTTSPAGRVAVSISLRQLGQTRVMARGHANEGVVPAFCETARRVSMTLGGGPLRPPAPRGPTPGRTARTAAAAGRG